MSPATSRTLAILSDTSDATAAVPHFAGADLVVHEATNACIRDDIRAGLTPEGVEAQARRRGHSTPQMAGRIAELAEAKHLVLTHFSARYCGSNRPAARGIMKHIVHLARSQYRRGRIAAAHDLMSLIVHINGDVEVQPSPYHREREAHRPRGPGERPGEQAGEQPAEQPGGEEREQRRVQASPFLHMDGSSPGSPSRGPPRAWGRDHEGGHTAGGR